jgi:predicted ATPase
MAVMALDSALFPFIDEFERAAGFTHADLPATRLRKLELLLARAAPPDEDVAFLDRLSSVRRVAQIGAAIGREFSYELLRTVSRLPEEELRASLAGLVASELVLHRGAPPDSVYSFKHPLVQDAAHGSLLRPGRNCTRQIAEALEAHFPERMDSQPELFAQHYAEAGLVEQSIVYWGKAGRRSATRSAMAEAAAQLLRGLDQLALLPETAERLQQELEFWSALGPVMNAVKGNAAVRARERLLELVYARLSEAASSPQSVPAA